MENIDTPEFQMMYELVDIENITDNGYENVIDISVTGDKTFLLDTGIVSHNSATGGLIDPIGRSESSFYSLKGKPLNAYSASTQKFTSNKELSELFSIIRNAGDQKIEDMPSGEWFEIEIDNKLLIVNENDTILYKNKWVDVKWLIE